MFNNRSGKRDPINPDPRHGPGQSLAEHADDLFDNQITFWLILTVVAVALAAWEWAGWLFQWKPQPGVFTVLAAIMVVIAFLRIRAAIPPLRSIHRGIRGEKAVGLFLQDQLMPKGYRVFHDICQGNFNIDHAVIGPGGVFAIETKTIGKRGGEVRVEYDGEHVIVDGHVPDRDPIVQARACAARLRDILAQYTGKNVRARSVVLYPGWWVCKQPRGVETWVLHHEAFAQFLDYEPTQLSLEEIDVLAAGLTRYIREQEQRGSL